MENIPGLQHALKKALLVHPVNYVPLLIPISFES